MKKLCYIMLFIFIGCSTNIDCITFHREQKLNEFAMDNNKYKIVFMGDSITEGGNFEYILNDTKNAGISGACIHDMKTVIPYITKYNPEKIYLLIGINSLLNFNIDECKKQYKEMINLMIESFPNTQIILETVLPTTQENPNIREFNICVKEIANKYNLNVLDLYSLYEVNDVLPIDITTDGLHLTSVGYNIWYNALEE